jgi:hypothetical protein
MHAVQTLKNVLSVVLLVAACIAQLAPFPPKLIGIATPAARQVWARDFRRESKWMQS